MKWIKQLFKPPEDETELKIKALLGFLFEDYGFLFIKINLKSNIIPSFEICLLYSVLKRTVYL